jgi:hypothetical protein
MLSDITVESGGSGTITNCTITSSLAIENGEVNVSDCLFTAAPLHIGAGASSGCVIRDNKFVEIPSGSYAITITGDELINGLLIAANYWDSSGAGFLTDKTTGGSQRIRLEHNRAGPTQGMVTRDQLAINWRELDVVLNGINYESLSGTAPNPKEYASGDVVVDTDSDRAYLIYDSTSSSGITQIGS